jgi:hypothetical protein
MIKARTSEQLCIADSAAIAQMLVKRWMPFSTLKLIFLK